LFPSRYRTGTKLSRDGVTLKSMGLNQIVSPSWTEIKRYPSFAGLLREHGVDLERIDPHELPLERGTPVYVEVDADPEVVQRRMILGHIRLLFVLEDLRVIGAIDLIDLINQAGEIAWAPDPS